jgi:bis(5'-nucleosyl)-tetraphosphatase (symmetrical)
MALYLIGDIQGCDSALERLLAEIAFSPSRDTLFALGDLVNRGPDSAAVLRRLMRLDGAARCLLGNHDLHLLAVAQGVRAPHRSDTLDGVLHAPDRQAKLDWLRAQPLAVALNHAGREFLMVHAGLLPSWTAADTLALAAEAESLLRSPDHAAFFAQMYGNEPRLWHPGLQGLDRIRCIVNALTRIRFCKPDGELEFEAKGLRAQDAPPGYTPWFDAPGRRTADVTVAFGHWSTLGWLDRPRLLSLDSGCVWGGCLTALQLPDDPAAMAQPPSSWRRVEVQCETAQKPTPSAHKQLLK